MKPETLIHAMLERSQKKLRIAAILPGGIYSYLGAAKKVKLEDGGPDITNPLMVGGNPNVGPATYYDRVPVAQTSELDTVSYEMTRLVGTYVISDQEVDENMGASKIVDIAATKMQALEISIKKYQRSRAASTNSGKDPNGLGNLLPAVNTSGIIGGINLASEPSFRHSVYDYDGSLTSANIEESFDDLLLDLNNDEGKVSVIFAGRRIFNMHRKAARDNASIQFGSGGFGQTLANLGLVGTNHQGIPLVYDEELHPDDAYFINDNELMIHVLKSANMKLKELTAPYDQDVIGGRYVMEQQLCSWKQFRTHAYVTNQA
jgi:hypothetical protein